VSTSNTQVELRQRLQQKYPSMSDAALRSAMLAAQDTLNGGKGAAPVKADRTAGAMGDRNAARAKDARKR